MMILYITLAILIGSFLVQIVFWRLHIKSRYEKMIDRFYIILSYLFIVFSILWMPLPRNTTVLFFILGLVLGWIMYVVSLFLLGTKINRRTLFLWYPQVAIKKEKMRIFRSLGKTIGTSLYEELFFRFAVLMLLQKLFGTLVAIVVTAAYFTIAHVVRREKQYFLLQIIDIFIFGFVLNLTYVITESLLMCFIAHVVRNCFVIMNNNMIILDRKKRMQRLIKRGEK